MKKYHLMKRKKGQLIVFGVLIFPVIFLCLAMVINVGMVVHDKINLQNSVDLAAIYAAQKQAEVMDAMAHINYQMRQSYKLFAWRYLILGNIGAFVYSQNRGLIRESSPPKWTMNILRMNPQNRALCPNAGIGCANQDCSRGSSLSQRCPYAVCTVHPLIHTTWGADNTHICQNYRDRISSTRQLPPVVQQRGVFSTISTMLGNDRVRDLRTRLTNNCSTVGFQNWIFATSMYFAFLEDQRKRKEFVEKKLFDQLLKLSKDAEGEDIKKGVERTIQKNLTYVNYKNFNPSHLTFNLVKSTSSGAGVLNPSSMTFEDFFEWDLIHPIPRYVQNHRARAMGRTLDEDTEFCKYPCSIYFSMPA